MPPVPDWLWEPFKDPRMVVLKEKIDFVARLLACLTGRPPNIPYPEGKRQRRGEKDETSKRSKKWAGEWVDVVLNEFDSLKV